MIPQTQENRASATEAAMLWMAQAIERLERDLARAYANNRHLAEQLAAERAKRRG